MVDGFGISGREITTAPAGPSSKIPGFSAALPDRVVEQRRTGRREELNVDVIGRDVHAPPARIRPRHRVSGLGVGEHPDRSRAPRQRIVDVVDDHVGEDVVVAVEEDLNAVVAHHPMDDVPLADVSGAPAAAAVGGVVVVCPPFPPTG